MMLVSLLKTQSLQTGINRRDELDSQTSIACATKYANKTIKKNQHPYFLHKEMYFSAFASKPSSVPKLPLVGGGKKKNHVREF
jgi:hypothetical protein